MDTFLTSLGLISVAQAGASNVDEMLAILTGAGSWLAAKGIDQWGPGQFSREHSAAAIERGEAYVAKLGDEVVGTLRLRNSDEPLWGHRPDDAFYIHGLAVKHTHAGYQIGLGLLCWAEQQASAADRKFLRLDCMAANPDLRSYYLKAGFSFVGEAEKNGWDAALFEREAKAVEEAAK